MTWFCPDNIEIAGKWGFRNIEIRNSLSEWYDSTEKYLHTILPVFILVLWVHIVQMKAFSHFNMAETYYFRDIMSLREAVANFNMHWSLSPSHCSQYVQVQNTIFCTCAYREQREDVTRSFIESCTNTTVWYTYLFSFFILSYLGGGGIKKRGLESASKCCFF
jgi:hypothetical protein